MCPLPRQIRRDTIILAESTHIVAGADTHADTIHVAAVTMTGAVVGDKSSPLRAPVTPRQSEYLTSLGHVERIGVEGTASYGAGFTRAVIAAGIEVGRSDPRGQVDPTAQGQVRSA